MIGSTNNTSVRAWVWSDRLRLADLDYFIYSNYFQTRRRAFVVEAVVWVGGGCKALDYNDDGASSWYAHVIAVRRGAFGFLTDASTNTCNSRCSPAGASRSVRKGVAGPRVPVHRRGKGVNGIGACAYCSFNTPGCYSLHTRHRRQFTHNADTRWLPNSVIYTDTLFPNVDTHAQIHTHGTSATASQVSAAEATALLAQLSAIDVDLVNELYRETKAAVAADAASTVASTLTPCEGITRLSAASASERDAWEAAGYAAIARGQAAALILAGGQGTRLGFDRPKGEYDVGLPSHKCLFQLQCERLRRVAATAGARAGLPSAAPLPLYVMTSPMTDADTRAFFASRGNFGLPASDVRFFCQGTLPCIANDGRIILESGGHVAEAPDGNGGIYRAAHLQGVVADMKARGVLGVHVFAVDNAIVRAADPVFLGYCLSAGADVGSKVCPKRGPHEKVGVLCKRNGAFAVVEYSEMDAHSAELRAPSGELVFNAGNLCIHYYSTAFLDSACAPAALPKVYHLAAKAIPFADPATGRTLDKAAMAGRGNTGVKLESFIFDVFPAARAMAVLEIDREAEFSPVKNAPGSTEDSPDTTRAAVSALHTAWLRQAGAVVGEGGAGALVEVSPLVSYGGEGLDAFAGVHVATPALVAAEGEQQAGADEVGEPLAGGAITHFARPIPGGAGGGAVHVYVLRAGAGGRA